MLRLAAPLNCYKEYNMAEMTYSLPVIDSIKIAWAKVKGAKGTIWAIFGMFFVAEIILATLGSFGLKPLFTVLLYILQIFSTISLMYIGIRRAQDVPIHYTMIKEALNLRTFLCAIGFYILQIIVFIPPFILCFLGGYTLMYGQHEPSTALNLLASLLYLVAAILFLILSMRMWLGLAFVIDKKMNPWEALKNSFKSTKGNVWNLIGLAILLILIMFVCTITLGIGLIWGMPWFLIIYGEVYKRLTSHA